GMHREPTTIAAIGTAPKANRKAREATDPVAILRRYLRFGEGGHAQAEVALSQALQLHPEELRSLLRAAAGRELERIRIVHGFSVNSLQQSLRLLLADRYALASLCLASLQTAMTALAGRSGSARWGDDCIDELLFCLSNESNADLAVARFVDAAAHGFRRASGIAIATLRERALQALKGMRSQPDSALQATARLLAALPAQSQKRAAETPPPKLPQEPLLGAGDEPMAVPEGMRLPVDNAGLVLLAPFLERYFAALDLLQGRDFFGPAQRMRATYLTQYLACGKQEAPESALLLNKILCGVSTAVPLDDPVPLGEVERQLAEQMLAAVIRHWSKLGNTSVAGLRETFLMRAGYLTRRENDWSLHVQRGPYDVLLQSLPWSIATIRLPWMEKPIWVQWI
ncbi:MAG: contractile injection system tape measure protein, partial [Burkholderiales bacterium]